MIHELSEDFLKREMLWEIKLKQKSRFGQNIPVRREILLCVSGEPHDAVDKLLFLLPDEGSS